MAEIKELNGHQKSSTNHLCDNKTESKSRIKILVISFGVLIFAVTISEIIYKYTIGHQETTKSLKNSKNLPEIQSSHDSIITNKFESKLNDYRKMIQFTDEILKSTLDDFTTTERIPVNLTDLSKFNNIHFAPRILSLVKLDPFKFVKFNLKRPCLLWSDTFSCTKMSCNIQFCNRDELPKAYLMFDTDESCPTGSPKELSKLDHTLTQSNEKELNRLFECSRDDSEDSQYYDLILNPERFTGYDGRQIWNAIYEENCFPMKNLNNIFSVLNDGCYEERIFHRIISGLHTSITIHLTAIHHKFKDTFGPNPEEYIKRFYGQKDYMKNLFLTYLIELHALFKIQPYLLNKIKWNLIEDKVQARDAIKALLNTETLFKWHFDAKGLFKHKAIAAQLGNVFNNISFNIMDCISCDKCRLWGKVQTNGLGTAFKIMLTKDIEKLKLSHHEITCLLNAISRLSFSITQISNFREILQDKDQQLQSNSNNVGDSGFYGKNRPNLAEFFK